MPTYEYHCDACEHEFEEFQSMSEPALQKCPKCHKKKLRRLFGIGAAVLFKGSGFYETDYRSESYKAAAKADSEAGKPAAKSDGDSSKSSATDTSSANGKTDQSGSAKSDSPAKKSSKSKT